MDSKFLDARTKDNKLRLTAFSTSIEALIGDFKDWLKENRIPNFMLWYADIFRCEDMQHMCSLELKGDDVILSPPPEGSNLSPLRRKRPLKYLLHHYK